MNIFFSRLSQTMDCCIDVINQKYTTKSACFEKSIESMVLGVLNTRSANFNTTTSVPTADGAYLRSSLNYIETSQLCKKCTECLASGHKVRFRPLSTQASLEPHVRVWTLEGRPWEHERCLNWGHRGGWGNLRVCPFQNGAEYTWL